MILALPTEEHARILFPWRNEAHTRAMSLRTSEIAWDNFWETYRQSLERLPDAPALFFAKRGEKVAFISFRPFGYGIEISLLVDPARRGEGIGREALAFATDWLRRCGWSDVYAQIRPANDVSIHLFGELGYKQIKDEEETLLFRLQITAPPLRSDGGPYIIAEAGSNWKAGTPEEDLQQAKELIQVAADAQADGIKFQLFRPETLYAPQAGSADYLQERGIEKGMDELFAELAMPHEMVPALAEECKRHGIDFLCTPFSPDDLRVIDPFVPFHKLGSYELGHLRLIEAMAATGKPVVFSCGAATPDEIEWAIETFRANHAGPLTLMQCTAAYPAPLSSLHLRTLPWLQKRFGVAVGLSDHSREPLEGPLAATALGAAVIEKHFTLSNALIGPDHRHAIEPHELKLLIESVRALTTALGNEFKPIDPVEEELRTFARRGIQALTPIESGDLFREGENVAILRPGGHPLGVHPKHIEDIEGKRAKRSLKPGEGVQHDDW